MFEILAKFQVYMLFHLKEMKRETVTDCEHWVELSLMQDITHIGVCSYTRA
jgi:hypothetical protein